MEKYNLDFCLKGNRSYIHGTDIFNKVIDLLQDQMQKDKIDLSFHGIATKNIYLIDEKPQEDLIKFIIKFNDKSHNRCVFYAIENDQDIDCKIEYDESIITNIAKIDTKSQKIDLCKETSFSFIENIVALNKYLLQNIFPDVKGKWYFTRLQLNIYPDNFYPIKLTLKANFNFKLLKTEIVVGSNIVGYIYFSLL
jgi:hypothetical protein